MKSIFLAVLLVVPRVSAFAPLRRAGLTSRLAALEAKAIIWDCDGVLVDSEALLKQVIMLHSSLILRVYARYTIHIYDLLQ